MAKKKVKKSSKEPIVKKSAKKSTVKKGKISQGLAIAALLLNILILPGLGSLIGGRTKAGIWQLVLVICGGLLSIIIIGIPFVIAGWIWGLVTGIQLINESG